jgi:hypothetical protein
MWSTSRTVPLIAFSNVDVKANSGAPPSGPGAPAKPAALIGFTPEPVERVDYERGATRAWPAGEHIVTVAVRTGRLTVYGPAGERQVYVAGETYTAGWTAYRTVNETNAIVETLLTRHSRDAVPVVSA